MKLMYWCKNILDDILFPLLAVGLGEWIFDIPFMKSAIFLCFCEIMYTVLVDYCTWMSTRVARQLIGVVAIPVITFVCMMLIMVAFDARGDSLGEARGLEMVVMLKNYGLYIIYKVIVFPADAMIELLVFKKTGVCERLDG